MNINKTRWLLYTVAIALLGAGCSTPTRSMDPSLQLPSEPFETTGLAGEWDVSDGAIEKTIVLDCQGGGRYAWQNGKVSTTSVRGNHWTGTWHQSKNDREGGFEVVLSEDRAKAEGRWWYSRIGEARFEPGERGGEFNMDRPLRTTVARDDCRRTKPIHAYGPH